MPEYQAVVDGGCVSLEKLPGDSDTQPLIILLPLKITPLYADLHCSAPPHVAFCESAHVLHQSIVWICQRR